MKLAEGSLIDAVVCFYQQLFLQIQKILYFDVKESLYLPVRFMCSLFHKFYLMDRP